MKLIVFTECEPDLPWSMVRLIPAYSVPIVLNFSVFPLENEAPLSVSFSYAKHGVYKIKSPSTFNGYSNVYCHMTSLPGCSGGGWTLVMKINGKKVCE